MTDRRGGDQGSFVSFSVQGTGDEGPRDVLLLRVVRVAVPLVTSLLEYIEEEARTPPPLSPRKRRRTTMRRPFPLRRPSAVLFDPPPFPSFLSYTPCYPTQPLRSNVCIAALPDGLIAVFVCSARPPARLLRCVRCSQLHCAVHGTTYNDTPPSLQGA